MPPVSPSSHPHSPPTNPPQLPPRSSSFTAGITAWLDKVPAHWPHRLIHIPTLTSTPRTGTSTYGTTTCPSYGILTYTWGRWKDRSPHPTPAVPISGTDWPIPSVTPDHFTVEAFLKVIARIGQEVEWVWIDVACIDQRDDSAQKAEEIGKQVGIFRGAKCCFVWLSRLSTAELSEGWGRVLGESCRLQFHGEGDAKLGDPDEALGEILPALLRALEGLFRDPWFSSLWTLQEAILRNDALVLSHEADTIALEEEGGEAYLAILVSYCSNIRKDLLRIAERRRRAFMFGRKHGIDQLISQVLEKVHEVGLIYLVVDNPNIQYGAARYRQTKRPLDRIYGITQIYGIAMGEAKELWELQDRFAGEICRRCPVLGQLFVHIKKPAPGDSWRITEFSSVPEDLRDYPSAVPKCTIEFRKHHDVLFTGKSILLVDFLQQWAQWLQKASADKKNYFDRHPEFLYSCLNLHIDDAAEEERTMSYNPYSPGAAKRDEVGKLRLPSVLKQVRGYGDLTETLSESWCAGTKVSDVAVLWLGTRNNKKAVSLREKSNEVGLLARIRGNFCREVVEQVEGYEYHIQ
ncbi:hypothetical protein BJ508DRAFT_151121 [Ascobolus immersus RN42]|uniref:Heterokaryon incompatibility domain-containing protein n=1 Tax=Ascobolus immersus RN42 TaxID=1160509 RepID=A0A3N4I0H1_ASCIM|nr:hypothetical protein BJ508DRAFT_151121 [Ascobolus immersus RN42]